MSRGKGIKINLNFGEESLYEGTDSTNLSDNTDEEANMENKNAEKNRTKYGWTNRRVERRYRRRERLLIQRRFAQSQVTGLYNAF